MRAVGEIAVAVGVEYLIESLTHQVGGAAAPEDAETVQLGIRCRTGADLHLAQFLRCQRGIVAAEGLALRIHAPTCRSTRYVGAVTAADAVDRVVIGHCRVQTVIVVAGKIVPA